MVQHAMFTGKTRLQDVLESNIVSQSFVSADLISHVLQINGQLIIHCPLSFKNS